MNQLFDPTSVTDKNAPANADPQNMGSLGNYFMYFILDLYYTYGTLDPSFSDLSTYANSKASSLESDGLIASGGATVIYNICTTLGAATDISDCINSLNTINNDANANPDFANNPILACTSIAYHSGKFWQQSVDPGTGNPPVIAKWIKLVCADIGGGLGGIGLGSLIPGVGTLIGGLVGAACGTIAASVPYVDPHGVDDKNKPSSTNFSDIGSWHNYYDFQALDQFYLWGNTNPILSTITDYMNTLASTLESGSVIPAGSATVVSNIADEISTGTDITSIISSLNDINNSALSNPSFTGTVALSITTIAYHSGVFWSQVKYSDSGLNLDLTKWQQYAAISVAGALNGISSSNDALFGVVIGSCIGGTTFETALS